MRVKFLSRCWRFFWVKQSLLHGSKEEETHGDCDPPDKAGKRIRVATRLGEQRTLEVLIHEALHALDWMKDEEWVDEASRDLARFLTRLGYRRKGAGEGEVEGKK